MRCLQCQHENPSDAKFCNQCGTPFAPECSTCGHENPADARFCNQCGTSFIATTFDPSPAQSMKQEIESKSRFYAVLPLIISLLQRERRLPFETLTDAFDLSEALLGKICEDLSLRRLATDEAGKVLVWTGEALAPAPSAVVLSQPASVETSVGPSTAVPGPSTAVPSPTPHTLSTVTEVNGSTVSPEVSPTDVSPAALVTESGPNRTTPEAERRQLTVMFCDLGGCLRNNPSNSSSQSCPAEDGRR
jgi:hypothetical protein